MPCCGCCGNGFIFGDLMYILEKIAAFCAMSAIISCIIVTVSISIGVGVGLGYNYCFVETKSARFTAVDKLINTKDPARLPESPNAFPFSGESSNEKDTTITTTENDNTIIEHSLPTDLPTFPDVPDISVSVSSGKPRSVSIARSNIPDIRRSSVSDPGLTSNLVDHRIYDMPNPIHFNPPKDIPSIQAPIPTISSVSGPEQETVPDSAYHGKNSNISTTSSPGGVSSDQLFVNRRFPSIPPQSPIFSESYRRIPTIVNKDRPAASELNPGGRLSLQRLEIRPITVKTLGEFDANQDDVGSGGTKRIEDTDYTEEPRYRQAMKKEKYRRRKPAQKKHIKKVTKSTTFMPTIVIPLKKYANLSPLISKILAQNKNVTLQFITL